MTAIKNGTLLVKDSNGNTARVATLSQTDITTLNTALADIEANKKRINSINANYVTTNTTQAITGTKVIKSSGDSGIFLQDTRFDIATSPEQDIFNSIFFIDKNAKNAGFVQSVQRKDSNNAIYLGATRDKNGQLESTTLGVVFPRDTTKVAYATAPQTPTSASNNEIATAKFVNDKINPIKTNYVTTNTAQDITAVKTFKTTTNHVVTKVVVTDRDNSVTPTEVKWTDAVQVFDKNNTLCGVLAFNQWPDGSNTVELHAEAPIASGNPTSAYIGIRGFKDGSFKTMCYTPQKDSNSSEIATTEWVNSKITTSHIGPPNYNAPIHIASGTTYTCPSNGWLLFVNDIYNTRSRGYLNGAKVFENAGQAGTWEDWNSLFIFAWKGNTCSITANAHITFWPCA